MDVANNLAQLRANRRLPASKLAAEIGVSRQTVYAIEAGTYVPNTAVSLKLARALEVAVEDIFRLSKQAVPPALEAEWLGDAEALQPGQPVCLCRVNDRLIAVPAEPGIWGLPAADATILAPQRAGKRDHRVKVQLLDEGWEKSKRILIAGCDPSAPIAAHYMSRQGLGLAILYVNSSRALELLKKGSIHIAGTHLVNERTGKFDLTRVKNAFGRNSVVVISYARWEEGLVVAQRNPKGISSVTDLARKDVQIANREPGAGCRRFLDAMLRKYSIAPSQVRGYERVTFGHLPAARLVRSGEVDCCISTGAAARALKLDFIPLSSRPYHFVVRRSALKLPAIQAFVEQLRRPSLRREVEASTGYDMSACGEFAM
jgi:molybdate-binding protein/DNA-binding XRE family transcriptional regulator